MFYFYDKLIPNFQIVDYLLTFSKKENVKILKKVFLSNFLLVGIVVRINLAVVRHHYI